MTAILFNIFGGITRCDEIAKGIIEACGRSRSPYRWWCGLRRHEPEEGLAILAEADAWATCT